MPLLLFFKFDLWSSLCAPEQLYFVSCLIWHLIILIISISFIFNAWYVCCYVYQFHFHDSCILPNKLWQPKYAFSAVTPFSAVKLNFSLSILVPGKTHVAMGCKKTSSLTSYFKVLNMLWMIWYGTIILYFPQWRFLNCLSCFLELACCYHYDDGHQLVFASIY